MGGQRSTLALTRQDLLEAGLRILIRDGLPAGFNLKLTDVVSEANRSTGAAYQIWHSQDDYRLELAAYVARNVAYTDPSLLTDALESAISTYDDITETVRAVGCEYFDQLVSSPEFYVSLHFWATADSLPAQVSAAVAESYDQLNESFSSFFCEVLARYGIRLDSRFSLSDLTTAATSISEGCALRHRFLRTEAQRARLRELYVEMLSAVLQSMVER